MTHRSKGAPWPPERRVARDGHSARACREGQGPRGSPDAGSHCGQTSPTACENV